MKHVVREADVVVLPAEVQARPDEPTPSPPGPLHGAAITGMALSALVGIAALFASITVGWPGDTAKYPRVVFVCAAVAFVACASVAVFTAARDTYANASKSGSDPDRRLDSRTMEIEGHPTQDIVEELIRRGGVRIDGGSGGPRVDGVRFLVERVGDQDGHWIFLPQDAYLTGLDDVPR